MIPQIIAHRGASYLAPENTLAAFRKAMEIGADGVEMDVQKTLDGGLVIHHDYIIDLHTDISGRIYDMTEGELKDLDFGSWKDAAYKDEKIATLAEALALCRSMEGCAVQLEMKSTMDNDPAFVSGVVDAIRAADIADRLVLISFNHDLLRQAKALMPELRVGVLLYGAFESMVLPPPVIWKDLGLVNGMEDEEAALDEELAALPVDAGMDPDEENGWMTRWVNDKVSMLRANWLILRKIRLSTRRIWAGITCGPSQGGSPWSLHSFCFSSHIRSVPSELFFAQTVFYKTVRYETIVIPLSLFVKGSKKDFSQRRSLSDLCVTDFLPPIPARGQGGWSQGSPVPAEAGCARHPRCPRSTGPP